LNIDYKNLPDIEKLDFNDEFKELFICALGFEDRCLGSSTLLCNNDHTFMHSIMLKYDTHIDDNERNYDKLVKLLNEITLHEINEIKYSISDPNLFYDDGLKKKISNIIMENDINYIMIDISSFNTTAIIQILDFLFSLDVTKIKVVYTEAIVYYPKDKLDTMKEEYLSSGISKILSLPTFNGYHTPGYSHLLIILLGLEPIRSRGIFNLLQPSRKIGIIGDPSRSDLKWRLNLSKNMYQIFFGDQDEYLILSEFYYKEVLNNLEKIYNNYYDYNNITITPLGSKMQTIAVLLHLLKHPDVQLLISLPIKYDPKRYSEGIGDSYQIIFSNENI